MKALLPHLIGAPCLVPLAVVVQLRQEPASALFRQLLDELLRGEFLEIGHDLAQVRPIDDRVEMMLHDDPAIEPQPFFTAAEFERFDENVAAGGGGEDGQPFEDRGGDEMRGIGLLNFVAAAHGGRVRRARGVGNLLERRNGVSRVMALPNWSLVTSGGILRTTQSPGDVVMLTAALREWKRALGAGVEIDVRTPGPALWEHNPHLSLHG